MTTIDPSDPGYQLHGRTFNAIDRALGQHQAFLPLSVRDAITAAAVEEFATWLFSEAIVGSGGAAIVSHDVDDCNHLPHRDCYDEMALRAYRSAADLIRQYTEARS